MKKCISYLCGILNEIKAVQCFPSPRVPSGVPEEWGTVEWREPGAPDISVLELPVLHAAGVGVQSRFTVQPISRHTCLSLTPGRLFREKVKSYWTGPDRVARSGC